MKKEDVSEEHIINIFYEILPLPMRQDKKCNQACSTRFNSTRDDEVLYQAIARKYCFTLHHLCALYAASHV